MKSSKKNPRKSEYRRNRGAVTIFLVIILVPCIALSSICVDLSRVQLSKASAVSAADLALNTLLTNYDGDLKDWYGMIGSCQDIQSYYSTASGYFTRSLSSKSLSDNELLLLSDVISSKFGDDQFFDVLQVEVVDGVKIQDVAGANLANPTLVKDQIVEFMKYRAPIELTKSIIERLSKESSWKEAKEADENKPLVEAKQDFYEAEGELLKAAYRSYLAIKDYCEKVDEVSLTNEKLAGYANSINGYRDTYQAVHNIAVSNLLNTGELHKFTRKKVNIGGYYSYDLASMSYVYSRTETMEGTDEVFYYISHNRMNSLVSAAESAISKFDQAKAAFQEAAAPVMATPPGVNDVNEIQWWVRMHKAVCAKNLHRNFSSAADAMMEHVRTLNAALECLPDPNSTPSSDLYSRCSSAIGQIESRHASYLTSSASSSDPYVNAANTLETISHNYFDDVRSSVVTVVANGSTMTVDNAIKTTGNTLTSIYNELVSVRDLLNIAIDGDGKKIPSLDSLADLTENYSTELDDYQSEADGSTTGMGATEREQISEEVANNRISEDLNRESVEELKKRLTNIRSQLDTLISAIETLTYGGTCLKDITTFAKFKEAALTKISASNIPLKNAEINSLASSSFPNLFKPSSGKIVDLKNTTGNSHNPQLNLDNPELTDTPKLLQYMRKKFGEADKETVDAKEDDQNQAKNKGDDAAKEAKGANRYHGGGQNLSSTYSSGREIKFAEGAWGTLVELIEILVDISKVTNIRDDLYVTSYIMEMFSYATFEEEGMYSLIEKKTELKLPTGKDTHTPTEYQSVLGSAETPQSWRSDSMEDSYNKTLTNKMIDKNNNVAYAAEVEYILKGQMDNVANVKEVYKDIYGIRYVLNLVSGFQHFFVSTSPTDNPTAFVIDTVANTIAGATMGIIPAPVTKVIIIPILAIFETAKDLDRLEAGFPVELYKIAVDDWWVSIPAAKASEGGIGNLLDNNPCEKTNQDQGIFYSDYLTMFVYLGLKSGGKADMYYRIADVIEANMAQATGSFKMEKARMYFSLNTTLRVKPMMVALPYYFDDYDNLMLTTTDWCTYKVNVVRGYS